MTNASNESDDIRDALPTDLNAVDSRAEYRFPDNSRRRIPATIYLVVGAAIVVGDRVSSDPSNASSAFSSNTMPVLFRRGWRHYRFAFYR
ncbi:MAG: hypothetical protein EBZ93_03635, partial [Actinobacteria bacterium]|nr:hypothetical protein [Actinomycetota bacterium]